MIADVQAAAAEAWFAQYPVGLYVLDTQLRIVSAGLATQIMGGVPAERVLGRRLTDVYSFSSPSFSSPGQIEAMLREVLDSGVPAPERDVVRLRLRDGPGRACWARVSAFRLEDQHGAVLGVAAVLADASELEIRRARLPLVSELWAQVGQTLDVVGACQDLVDAVVPGVADLAVVELVDSVVRGEDPPLAPLGREVPLRRAAFRSSGEPDVQAHPAGELRTLPFPSPYAQALTDLKPRVVDLGPDTPWLSADPARAEAIRASGARTLITVPLALRGAVLGLICLYRTEQVGSFNELEVDLLVRQAAMIALSVDRARLAIGAVVMPAIADSLPPRNAGSSPVGGLLAAPISCFGTSSGVRVEHEHQHAEGEDRGDHQQAVAEERV